MSNNTKEQIAEEALKLFSLYGYSAVSIRRICKAVGIKESTIYYHYKSKQAILEALLERVERIADEKQLRFDAEFAKTEHVSEEAMIYVANHLLDDYLLHPSIYPLICILSIERMHDEAADKKYRHIVFDMPLSQQKKVFRAMADRKMILPDAEEEISELYYGVIYSAFSALCLGRNEVKSSVDAAHARIAKAIGRLFSLIRTEGSHFHAVQSRQAPRPETEKKDMPCVQNDG